MTIGDLEDLPDDELVKLLKRAEQEEEAQQRGQNTPDYFQELPKKTSQQLKAYLHEQIRESSGLLEGVRVHKRNIAPVVQAVAAMDFEKWGYVLYRTTYKNAPAWDDFMAQFKSINDGQLKHPNKGGGLEMIEDMFEMTLAVDQEVEEGANFADCVKYVIPATYSTKLIQADIF